MSDEVALGARRAAVSFEADVREELTRRERERVANLKLHVLLVGGEIRNADQMPDYLRAFTKRSNEPRVSSLSLKSSKRPKRPRRQQERALLKQEIRSIVSTGAGGVGLWSALDNRNWKEPDEWSREWQEEHKKPFTWVLASRSEPKWRNRLKNLKHKALAGR